jgi:hypothetical protein
MKNLWWKMFVEKFVATFFGLFAYKEDGKSLRKIYFYENE